jgi:hypothetical protein
MAVYPRKATERVLLKDAAVMDEDLSGFGDVVPALGVRALGLGAGH